MTTRKATEQPRQLCRQRPRPNARRRAERWAERALSSLWFALRGRRFARTRKILFCLTPTNPNLGDHAQAVAALGWFRRHFPERPVFEFDAKQVWRLLPALRRAARPDDLVFIQGGGNLGDRYAHKEQARREIVAAFPRCRVISLPQTVSFSDTPEGRHEAGQSRRVYGAHPDLTVMVRDARSAELAAELFPRARTLLAPDMALSLDPAPGAAAPAGPPAILLCLRQDAESALTPAEREELAAALPGGCRRTDTVLDCRVGAANRQELLDRKLDEFRAVDLVVTDRFHGLVFAALCRRPCVALPTADHKMTSGAEWFRGLPFVALARSAGEVPGLARRCLAAADRTAPDWNALYFDALPARLGLQ